MRYLPEGRGVECRRLHRLLDQVDAEVSCSAFQAREQDLDRGLVSTEGYYQAISHDYDELWYSAAACMRYGKAYSLVQDRIGQLTSRAELVLDAGCGTCEWSSVVIEKGGQVVGFDKSSEMLRVGREKIISQGRSGNLSLVRGDVVLLPFKEKTFDGLTCLFVLSHLPDEHMCTFLAQLGRVVKEDGWMLFLDSRLGQLHLQEELQVRTLRTGEDYVVYKRYFEHRELATLLEEETGRLFSSQEIDRHVICVTNPRTTS